MPDITTRVIKIPVRILEEDEDLRIRKYKALDEMMREARYLGNMAIRYAIAFKLDGIPKEIDEKKGTPVHLDTRIYRILTQKKRWLNASTVATLSRNFALKVLKSIDKDAWEGKKSLPTYRSLFVPFRHQGSALTAFMENDRTQFLIEPSFGREWLSDEMAIALQKDTPIADKQRRLVLASCLSQKDQCAREIIQRIATGQYPMGDSQIKLSGRNLTVLLTYKMKQVRPELDPERVCGVSLGVYVPAVCAVNFGPQRLFIGNGSEIWAARSKFRAERRRKERGLGADTGATRGVRSEKEERWMHTYCHALTRQVIRFCLEHGCGRIQMEAPEMPRRGGSWNYGVHLVSSPSKFCALLDYKAQESGIRIVKIHPGNSACRCSRCGHRTKADRNTEPLFACVLCGRRVNADYNAARNICLAQADDAGATIGEELSNEAVPLGGAMR